MNNREEAATGNFLVMIPGEALVDPGAGQDLVGLSQFRKLEELWQ